MVKKKKSNYYMHGGSQTPQYFCPVCKKAHTEHSIIGILHIEHKQK
jgi:hypothetical protein